MKKLSTFIVLVAIGVVGYLMWPNLNTLFAPGETEEAPAQKLMSVESYVSQNISELSPVKEQVGGTFFVTDIEVADGRGVVSYEDGHNAYTADFTYTSDDRTGHKITSFEIR